MGLSSFLGFFIAANEHDWFRWRHWRHCRLSTSAVVHLRFAALQLLQAFATLILKAAALCRFSQLESCSAMNVPVVHLPKTLLSSQVYMRGQRRTKRRNSHEYHRDCTVGGHFHSDDHRMMSQSRVFKDKLTLMVEGRHGVRELRYPPAIYRASLSAPSTSRYQHSYTIKATFDQP